MLCLSIPKAAQNFCCCSASVRNVAVSFLYGRPSPELAVCHQETRREQNKSLFLSDPVKIYKFLDNDQDNFESSPNEGLLLPGEENSVGTYVCSPHQTCLNACLLAHAVSYGAFFSSAILSASHKDTSAHHHVNEKQWTSKCFPSFYVSEQIFIYSLLALNTFKHNSKMRWGTIICDKNYGW